MTPKEQVRISAKQRAQKSTVYTQNAWQTIRQKVQAAIQGAVEALLFFLDPGALSTADELHRSKAREAMQACLGNHPAEALLRTPPQERGQALAELHAAMAQALGLTPCTVTVTDLHGSNGGYAAAKHLLLVHAPDLEKQPMTLQDAKILLDTICHETYHALQYQAVIRPGRYGIEKNEAKIWRINFKHYITLEENPERYWLQPLETAARIFAASVVKSFYDP